MHDNDDRADILENDNELTMRLTNNTSDFEKVHDDNERLSTIYESVTPQPRTDDEYDAENETFDDAYDKLIVYDIASAGSIEKVMK